MHISCPKLFDPSIQVNRKIKRAMVRCLGGLVLYPGKKNCSAIARAANESIDDVYNFLEFNVEEKDILQTFLNKAIFALPLGKGIWYISIDSIVAAAITNGKITIPITFRTWYSAKDFPDKHKTRIELAQVLMVELHKIAPGIMFLMDGAFSS